MSGKSEIRGVARTERLKRREAFQAVFRRGKRVECPSVLVLWRGWDGPRQVGFAVSRQVGGAVRRNRAKRRLREAYRATSHALPAGVQLVCMAREATTGVSFETLLQDMRGAFAVVARHLRGGATR